MRKILVVALVALLTLLLLGGGAAGWWYFLRPAGPSAAAYLPAETLLFVEVPDGAATLRHYRTCPWRKIFEHPTIRAFWHNLQAASPQALAKATAALPAPQQKEAETVLASATPLIHDLPLLLRGDSFAALTRVDLDADAAAPDKPKAERVGFLVGFRTRALPFVPDHGADSLFQALTQALSRGHAETLQTFVTDRNGIPCTSVWTTEGPLKNVHLCRARVGEWNVIAWGEQPLFDWVDRATGKTPRETSLLASDEYRKATAEVDPKADVLEYAGPGCIDLYVKLLEKFEAFQQKTLEAKVAAQTPPPAPGTEAPGTVVHTTPATPTIGSTLVRKMFPHGHAAAGSLSLTPNGTRSSGLWTFPHADRELYDKLCPPKTRFESASLTTPTTLAYVGSSLDLGAELDLIFSMPGMEQASTSITDSFKTLGLDWRENFVNALGNEDALVIDWPEKQDLPDVLLAFSVASADRFTPLFDKIAAVAAPALAMFGTAENFTAGDYRAVAVHPKQSDRLSPTLFDGPHFWGLSLRAEGAKRLLPTERAAADGKPLAQETLLGPLADAKVGDGFTKLYWMNVGKLYDRTYPVLAPKAKAYLAAHPPKDEAGLAPFRNLPDPSSLGAVLGEWRMAVTADPDAVRVYKVWTP